MLLFTAKKHTGNYAVLCIFHNRPPLACVYESENLTCPASMFRELLFSLKSRNLRYCHNNYDNKLCPEKSDRLIFLQHPCQILSGIDIIFGRNVAPLISAQYYGGCSPHLPLMRLLYIAKIDHMKEREFICQVDIHNIYIICNNGRLPVKALAHRSWPPITKKHNGHILTEEKCTQTKNVQK